MIGILIKCCANCGYNKDDKCTSRDTLITTVIADDWCPEWKEMEGDDGVTGTERCCS